MAETLVVIDGYSLMHRAFYALPILSNKNGIYTNAVYGFCSMLFKIVADYAPSYLAVAFDHKGPTFRHSTFEAYKAGRKATPEELRPQFDLLREVLEAMEIPCYELAGYEADDIIGTFSRLAEEKMVPCLLVTGDRDAWQLIGNMTRVLFTRKGISQVECLDTAGLAALAGVRPEQVPDLKGLMGDASDNIPGLPGVGEKTALKLLGQFGTLENVLENPDQVSGKKLQATIREFSDQARMSKQLATIDREVPLHLDFAACQLQWPPPQKALDKFESLEMRSLLSRLPQTQSDGGEKAPVAEIQRQRLTTLEALAECVASLKDPVALTLTPDALTLADSTEREYTVALKQSLLDEADALEVQAAVQAIKGFLEDDKRPKVLHEAKKLYHLLLTMGVTLRGIAYDTAISAYLLNATAASYPLNQLLEEVGLGSEQQGAAMLMRLKNMQSDEMAKLQLQKLFDTVEMPLVDVLIEMETQGFKIDSEALRTTGERFADRLALLADEIYTHAQGKFNINSTKQLGEVLFEKLSLPHGRKTKTGYSTDNEVLEGLRGMHPIIEQVIEYRQLMKLKSTYIDGMLAVIDRRDQKIHTSFQQTVTATGRISSTEPNLQNIPVRTDMGRELRRFFVASAPDRVLVDADYSQIELRVLAHMSGDATLIDAFQKGQDIHTRTAAEMWGVPMDQVTGQMRSNAKAINFGIVYGISDFGLARNTGISRTQAAQFIEKYFETYPGVKAYMDEAVANAKEVGYVTTLLGRRRPLPELHAKNYNQRAFGERVAMNAPIQGTAADIIKLAMIAVNRALRKEDMDAHLILQVHDELIVDAAAQLQDTVATLMRREMEQVLALKVPLAVDVHAGYTWYDAK